MLKIERGSTTSHSANNLLWMSYGRVVRQTRELINSFINRIHFLLFNILHKVTLIEI